MATGYEELLQNQQDQINNFGQQLAELQRQQAQTVARQSGFASQYAGQINDLIGRATQERTYESPYAQRISDLSDTLNNSRFTYRSQDDPNYQALRKQYLLESERTASDVLGKASAATGGRASTQAVSAASQAANYYKHQLNTQQQALFDSAYNRYYQDYQMKLAQLNDLENQEASNYNRWSNDYSNLLQQISTLQGQDATDYTRWYNEGAQALAQRNTAYSNMVNAIAQTGWTPTDAELSAAGMSRAEANAWKNYYSQQLLGYTSGGGGGGSGRSYGGSGSGGSSGGSVATDESYSAALTGAVYSDGMTDADIANYAAQVLSQNPNITWDGKDIKSMLKDAGFSSDSAQAFQNALRTYGAYSEEGLKAAKAAGTLTYQASANSMPASSVLKSSGTTATKASSGSTAKTTTAKTSNTTAKTAAKTTTAKTSTAKTAKTSTANTSTTKSSNSLSKILDDVRKKATATKK